MANAASKTVGAPGVRVPSEALPQILYQTDGFIFGHTKNVTQVVWATPATPALAVKLAELSERVASAHPEGISAIHIITKNARLPTEETRKMLQDVVKRFADRMACLCYVLEGSGFWASAVQSFVTGIHWISRGPYKLLVCSNIQNVAPWLCERHATKTGVVVDRRGLEQDLKNLRRRLD